MEALISLETMRQQVADCQADAQLYGWEFSEINESSLTFTVRLLKSRDGEVYKLHVQFDNYPQWPPLLDFIDEESGEIGVKTAYPRCDDSFFNIHRNIPVICHPYSRKAYSGHTGLHTDWGEFSRWSGITEHGKFENLGAFLIAVFGRLNSDKYHGRMEKRIVAS